MLKLKYVGGTIWVTLDVVIATALLWIVALKVDNSNRLCFISITLLRGLECRDHFLDCIDLFKKKSSI